MRRLIHRGIRWAFVGLAMTVLCALVADRWLWPLPVEKLNRPGGAFVYSREDRLLAAFTSPDRFWRRPVGLDRISPRLQASVLECEDRWFRYHWGVNPVSLVSAAVDNLRAGRAVRGGSTITMQIARMIEPKERTIGNKLIEIARAVQLEWRYSKDELLEIYFNLAPYGGNIEGVGAAAYFYFDKHPHELTWSEAAVLTAIPASPERFRPDYDLDACRARRDRVLRRLLDQGVISSAQYAAALDEEIPNRRQPYPSMAPHFAQSLRQKHPEKTELHSTLAFETQAMVERLGGRHHDRIEQQDIHNLAVVVIDNQTAEVLALVGSPDFADIAHQGQVNGALAPRSPGSALKPFVYALGFDKGILSPGMMLEDIPVSYSGYEPVNYDEEYHGLVTVRQALIHSYNVPAVNAASRVGLSSLHHLLRRGGLSTLDRKWYEYGLPLVLGAVEVPLLDMTALYSSLARGGEWVEPRLLRDRSPRRSRHLLSRGACYLVSDIMVDLHRPDLPSCWETTLGRPRVAWKTGTSYGRKDAWAIGYNPDYTVGVWAGNFDGHGSVDLVGAETAAPLLFDIFDELVRDNPDRWFDRPPQVAVREVCATTGKLPNRYCPHLKKELCLIGSSPLTPCGVHQPILVDQVTGLRLRALCADQFDAAWQVAEIWPPKVATWLASHSSLAPLPGYHTACDGRSSGFRPQITSPRNGAVIELIDFVPSEFQKIALEASVPGGDGFVHWFVDGQLLAQVDSREELLWQPEPGSHVFLCLDEEGRSDRVAIRVR